MDEAQQRALQVDVLGDEQSDEADHGSAPVPALVLRVEGAGLAAVGGLLVVDGDQSGADDDRRHAQEPDESTALRSLLPHALAGENLGDEGPGDAQHGQTAVDGLRRRPVELHQALRAGVAVLRAPLLLRPVEHLHGRALEDAAGSSFFSGSRLVPGCIASPRIRTVNLTIDKENCTINVRLRSFICHCQIDRTLKARFV